MIKYQNKCPCGCDEPNYELTFFNTFGFWIFRDGGYWWFRFLLNIRLFRGWVSYSNAQGWKIFNYNKAKDYESEWKMHWH